MQSRRSVHTWPNGSDGSAGIALPAPNEFTSMRNPVTPPADVDLRIERVDPLGRLDTGTFAKRLAMLMKGNCAGLLKESTLWGSSVCLARNLTAIKSA
jgi:hypothetical protein